MNKERMLLLADLLDSLKPVNFNMENWFSTNYGFEYDENEHTQGDIVFGTQPVQVMNGYDCNAAACIAGWAVVMKHDFALNRPNEETVTGRFVYELDNLPILVEAADYLGLTRAEAYDLFTYEEFGSSLWDEVAEGFGLDYGFSLSDITPKMAAEVIRKIVRGELVLNKMGPGVYD